MPCMSDYLEPTGKEVRLRETAALFVYALTLLGRCPPAHAIRASRAEYCADDLVPDLCALITGMTTSEQELIVYNAHSADSRKLAAWWEEHRAADAKRRIAEDVVRTHRLQRLPIFNKLTPEERVLVFDEDEIAALTAMSNQS